MKTDILQLESYDDVVSARDKMGWARSGRILLVWPAHGRIMTRRLDLVLLQRTAADLGAQLALVTRDLRVRMYARELSIPVYWSVTKAQEAKWKGRHPRLATWESLEAASREQGDGRPGKGLGSTPPPRAPTLSSPAVRFAFFTLGVLALLAIAAVLVPQAELHLTPRTQPQQAQIEVTASSEEKTVKLSGQLPASRVTVVVEGRDVMTSTGYLDLPDTPASGEVEFRNLTDQAIMIPSGSMVMTLDTQPGQHAVQFATTEPGMLRPGVGVSLTIPVQAIAPGRQGNLAAGELRAVGGLLGTMVEVQNHRPMQGGSNRQQLGPTEVDRWRLLNRLTESLRVTAADELRASLPPGDFLSTPSLELKRTLEQAFDPAENSPADNLTLHLRLEFSGLVVRSTTLHDLAQGVLDASVPAGFTPLQDTLVYENLSQPVQEGGEMKWTMSMKRMMLANFPESQAVEAVVGLPPAQARQRLSALLPLAKPPEITLSPSWWPYLPILPFRITVRQEE
jgi:hypothetical protein